MTNAQKRTIETLERAIKCQLLYAEDYEIREFKVEELISGNLSVIFETGKEGTAFFSRDRGHVFIGKNGGTWTYNKNSKKVGIKATNAVKITLLYDGIVLR